MQKLFFVFILIFLYSQLFSQSPASASNPMTAPGAIGINLSGTYLNLG